MIWTDFWIDAIYVFFLSLRWMSGIYLMFG